MTDAALRQPQLSHSPIARSERIARLDGNPWTPYLFAAPVVLYLLLFQGYPLLRELMLSFTQTSLLTPQTSHFVGMRNYAELAARPDFWRVIGVTALYTAICVVLAIALGLGAALLLDRPFRGAASRVRSSPSPGRRHRSRSPPSSPGC